MALRRVVVVAALVLGVSVAGCYPSPGSPTGSEHDQCVYGAESARAYRPDLVTSGYTCANYGNTGWVGLYDAGPNQIYINENYSWYDAMGSIGYNCVAAHEMGHAWDWNRLGWSHGGWTTDPEAYAQWFAATYFGC